MRTHKRILYSSAMFSMQILFVLLKSETYPKVYTVMLGCVIKLLIYSPIYNCIFKSIIKIIIENKKDFKLLHCLINNNKAY
jgi:hypothetical protein